MEYSYSTHQIKFNDPSLKMKIDRFHFQRHFVSFILNLRSIGHNIKIALKNLISFLLKNTNLVVLLWGYASLLSSIQIYPKKAQSLKLFLTKINLKNVQFSVNYDLWPICSKKSHIPELLKNQKYPETNILKIKTLSRA